MKNTKPLRQKLLEDFLNDEVERLHLKLYKWRGIYYEVLTLMETRRRHNWSGFVSLAGDWKMREASPEVIKKYYPKVTID